MANFYWIGSGGNTNDAANWSLTSGGAGGAGVPVGGVTGDIAYFDSNSGNATVNAALNVNTIQCAGYNGTITINNTIALSCINAYLSSTTTITGPGILAFPNATGWVSDSTFDIPAGCVYDVANIRFGTGTNAQKKYTILSDNLVLNNQDVQFWRCRFDSSYEIHVYDVTLIYYILDNTIAATVPTVRFYGNISWGYTTAGRWRLPTYINCGSNTLTLTSNMWLAENDFTYIDGTIDWQSFGFYAEGNVLNGCTLDFTPTIPYILASASGTLSYSLLSDLTVTGDFMLPTNSGINTIINNSGSLKTITIGGKFYGSNAMQQGSGVDPIVFNISGSWDFNNYTQVVTLTNLLTFNMVGAGFITGCVNSIFNIDGDYDIRDIFRRSNCTLNYISGTLTYTNAKLLSNNSNSTINLDWDYPGFIWQEIGSLPTAIATINMLSDIACVDYNGCVQFTNNSSSAKTLSVGGNWNSTTNALFAGGSDPINITMIGTGYITGYILGNFTIAGDYDLQDIYTAQNTVFTYSSGILTYANATLRYRTFTYNINYPGLVWKSLTNLGNNLNITLQTNIYTNFFQSQATALNGSSYTLFVAGDFTLNGEISGDSSIEVIDDCMFNIVSGDIRGTGTFNINIPSGTFTMVSDLTVFNGTLKYTQGTIDAETYGTSLFLNAPVTLDTSLHTWNKVTFANSASNRNWTFLSDFNAISVIQIFRVGALNFTATTPINLNFDSLINDIPRTESTITNVTDLNSKITLNVRKYLQYDFCLSSFAAINLGNEDSGEFTLGNFGFANTSVVLRSKRLISLPGSSLRIANGSNQAASLFGFGDHKVNVVQFGSSIIQTNFNLLCDGLPQGFNVDNPALYSTTSTSTNPVLRRCNISIIGKPTEISHNIKLSNINIVSGTHNLLEGTQQYAGLGLTRSDWDMGNNNGNIFHESQLPKGTIGNNSNSV